MQQHRHSAAAAT